MNAPAQRPTVRDLIHDGWVMTRRNLIKMKRLPDIIVFAAIQPVLFVGLFGYVFGSAMKASGTTYREFLMAGIFAQTVAFSSANTTIGVADDVQRGVLERFRSLPIAQSSVLIGRTTADLLVNVMVTVLLALCGLLVGWRIRTSVPEAIAGFALLLLFAYTMTWVSALIGLTVRSVEVAQSAGFVWLLPLSFVSNAFVPTAGLPAWLRYPAEWNPISAVTTAQRRLFGNTSDELAPIRTWPDRHAALLTVLWCLGLLAIVVPLAARRYRITTRR